MIPEILRIIACPQCSSRDLQHDAFDQDARGRIVDGVVWCDACHYWYPIVGGVLELLPARLAYHEDRAVFRARHAPRLRAHGLNGSEPGAPEPVLSPEAKQQRHFDWYALNDTQTWNAYERTPFWQAVDTMVFREWRKAVSPGARLLDVGCAQGRSSARLMDCDLTLVGFDISKALVRQAHDRYASRDSGARAVFFVGDASRFPFVDASFDYILVYGVLHHLEDPAHACAEIARVLKAGGRYFGVENNVTVLRPIFDLLQRLWPLWHEEAGAKPLMSASELGGWFERAGMAATARSTVFLPPHLANHLSPAAAERAMGVLEKVAGCLPILRHQGGLLLASGTKPAQAVDA